MKTILRNTTIYAVTLVGLSNMLSGVVIRGGFFTYIVAGFALALLFMIVKPILSIISFPLNLVTLGLFSSLTNIIILYLLTVFVPQVKIMEFTFHRASFAGFIVPTIHFNTFFAFVIASIVLSLVITYFNWLLDK